MSTPKLGYHGGTQDQSTRTGYDVPEKRQPDTSGLGTTPQQRRSPTRYGEQMELFSVSSVAPWNRVVGRVIDTREV